jgi:hypothetical protein
MSTGKKHSVLDKEYEWPDYGNVDGKNYTQAVYIGRCIETLGRVIHDFAKMMEQKLTEQ